MTGRAVMELGTTSHAGKSWLATALCRWCAREGLKVAPFKAQNMRNNARTVPGLNGALGEIGSVLYFQRLAAPAEPEVRMHPVLLEPQRDTASQVVVFGEVRADLARVPWRERTETLWPFAPDALHALLRENELVVIEGAGSPAEINLHASDYANVRTAREAQAACLLVGDIDRGGDFAHLFGTHQLLPADERALIRDFVLNRFGGDAGLLAPGPQQLQQLAGVPTLAVLPMWRRHGLPEEDGVFEVGEQRGIAGLQVAIVAFPRIDKLDEFEPLRDAPGVCVPGCARRASSRAPTGSCCRARRRPVPVWNGCARKASMRESRATPRPAAECSACAAACRCWAASRTIPTKSTVTRPPRAPCPASVCCRGRRASSAPGCFDARAHVSAPPRARGRRSTASRSRAARFTTAARSSKRARLAPASRCATRRTSRSAGYSATCSACTCTASSSRPPCCGPCLGPKQYLH